MKPLKIEFRPHFPRRAAGLWAAVATLTMVAGYLGWETWRVRADTEQLSRENAALEAKIRQLQAKTQSELVPQPYLEAIAELVAISRFPLETALAVLERIDVPGVKIASIDINALVLLC